MQIRQPFIAKQATALPPEETADEAAAHQGEGMPGKMVCNRMRMAAASQRNRSATSGIGMGVFPFHGERKSFRKQRIIPPPACGRYREAVEAGKNACLFRLAGFVLRTDTPTPFPLRELLQSRKRARGLSLIIKDFFAHPDGRIGRYLWVQGQSLFHREPGDADEHPARSAKRQAWGDKPQQAAGASPFSFRARTRQRRYRTRQAACYRGAGGGRSAV